MAADGLRVCVLTIDPAKRLADSLGLRELTNEARKVDPALLRDQGIEMQGELWAMMLDAKATFDEVVRRNAPDEESRDRVLNNRIYNQISNALAGSQEYMAMEKLYELHEEERFDLLVLDTPPSRNALDFLDAPRRLTQFIEGRSLRVFMKPTGLAARVAGRGASVALSVMKRLLGFDLLDELSEFFTAFSGMVDGFQERARKVNELLADPETCFLVVCGPQGEPISEAVYFHGKLMDADLPFGGVIVNKVNVLAEGDDGAPEPGDTEAEERPARRTRAGAGRRPARRRGSRPTSPTTAPWPSATTATSAPSPTRWRPTASSASPTSTKTSTTWPAWPRSTGTCSAGAEGRRATEGEPRDEQQQRRRRDRRLPARATVSIGHLYGRLIDHGGSTVLPRAPYTGPSSIVVGEPARP